MEKAGKILAVDDNEDILLSLKLLLKKNFEIIHTEADPQKIPELIEKENYDVILLDMNFTKDVISGKEGYYWLERILEVDRDAVIIFITAYGDVSKAVKAIKAGAVDFVLKPWQNEKLVATVSSAIQLRKSRTEAHSLRNKQEYLNATLDRPFHDFIGQSEEMLKVFEAINKVAKTDANVLILGENGTGKELVARALHRNSYRKEEIFLTVDLGSIAETLFESELFGHVRGAFTDAKKDKPGRFEAASGGTLFLDEIGNLSLAMQAKLLTAIEKNEVTRVGSNRPLPVNVRLICATNLPLRQMVQEKRFRQDLMYRINTVEIHLPPLRERYGDIPLLTDHFLRIYSTKYRKKIRRVSVAAIKKLEEYPWPGNVRELQHAIERAVIMCETDILRPEDFLLSPSSGSESSDLEMDSLNISDVERSLIQKVIKKHQGNISQAAKELGLTRASLYRRLEKYSI